jgi:hypothetical protein
MQTHDAFRGAAAAPARTAGSPVERAVAGASAGRARSNLAGGFSHPHDELGPVHRRGPVL